jgi:dipeptidyl aminopeptidase/acylaminoacyl peptidase
LVFPRRLSRENTQFQSIEGGIRLTQGGRCIRHWLIGLAGICSGLALQQLGAQQTLPLSVSDAVMTHSFGDASRVAYSPDGAWLAYMVRDDRQTQPTDDDSEVRTGIPSRILGGDVWITSSATGHSINLTGGHGSSWDPVWSPDGRYLAFLSDRDGSGQAKPWLWDSERKDLRETADVNVRTIRYQGIQWTPDSRKILITAIPAGWPVSSFVTKVLSPGNNHTFQTETVPGATVTLYRAYGPSPADRTFSTAFMFNLDAAYLRDLLLVDVTTGETQHLVAGQRIGWYAVSPNGQCVAYARPKRFIAATSFQRIYDVIVISLANNREWILASDILLDDVFSWSPNSDLLAYAAYDPERKAYSYYVVDLNGHTPQKICVLPSHAFTGGYVRVPMWDPEGQRFYFVSDGALWSAPVSAGTASMTVGIRNRTITQRLSRAPGLLWTDGEGTSRSTIVIARDDVSGSDSFYKVNLATGDTTLLLERSECYTCKVGLDIAPFDVAISPRGNYLAYCAENAERAPDLWVTDIRFRYPKQLTHMNTQFERYKMGTARLIEWLSDDGDRLKGALLLPSDFRPGDRYPLLVWVYPGTPSSRSVDRFGFGEFPGPLNLQLFATRGYLVLLPDTRDQLGDRTSALLKSVLPAINRVVEMGLADPDRVGVIGHSQGGYATVALIAKTQRFKAAVEIAGWGDYAGLYGFMNEDGTGFQYGQSERQLGGAPWERPVTYVENSPLFFLDRVQTPLLIVHGSNDETVPSFLADQMFVGLRRLGKLVEYAKYSGASHSPRDWSSVNQIDLGNRVVDWLRVHLKSE